MSDDKKISLATKPEKLINKSCLLALDDIKKRVEAGEIVDLAISYVCANGTLGYVNSHGADSIKLWSSMLNTERQFHQEYLQNQPYDFDDGD